MKPPCEDRVGLRKLLIQCLALFSVQDFREVFGLIVCATAIGQTIIHSTYNKSTYFLLCFVGGYIPLLLAYSSTKKSSSTPKGARSLTWNIFLIITRLLSILYYTCMGIKCFLINSNNTEETESMSD